MEFSVLALALALALVLALTQGTVRSQDLLLYALAPPTGSPTDCFRGEFRPILSVGKGVRAYA